MNRLDTDSGVGDSDLEVFTLEQINNNSVGATKVVVVKSDYFETPNHEGTQKFKGGEKVANDNMAKVKKILEKLNLTNVTYALEVPQNEQDIWQVSSFNRLPPSLNDVVKLLRELKTCQGEQKKSPKPPPLISSEEKSAAKCTNSEQENDNPFRLFCKTKEGKYPDCVSRIVDFYTKNKASGEEAVWPRHLLADVEEMLNLAVNEIKKMNDFYDLTKILEDCIKKNEEMVNRNLKDVNHQKRSRKDSKEFEEYKKEFLELRETINPSLDTLYRMNYVLMKMNRIIENMPRGKNKWDSAEGEEEQKKVAEIVPNSDNGDEEAVKKMEKYAKAVQMHKKFVDLKFKQGKKLDRIARLMHAASVPLKRQSDILKFDIAERKDETASLICDSCEPGTVRLSTTNKKGNALIEKFLDHKTSGNGRVKIEIDSEKKSWNFVSAAQQVEDNGISNLPHQNLTHLIVFETNRDEHLFNRLFRECTESALILVAGSGDQCWKTVVEFLQTYRQVFTFQGSGGIADVIGCVDKFMSTNIVDDSASLSGKVSKTDLRRLKNRLMGLKFVDERLFESFKNQAWVLANGWPTGTEARWRNIRVPLEGCTNNQFQDRLTRAVMENFVSVKPTEFMAVQLNDERLRNTWAIVSALKWNMTVYWWAYQTLRFLFVCSSIASVVVTVLSIEGNERVEWVIQQATVGLPAIVTALLTINQAIKPWDRYRQLNVARRKLEREIYLFRTTSGHYLTELMRKGNSVGTGDQDRENGGGMRGGRDTPPQINETDQEQDVDKEGNRKWKELAKTTSLAETFAKRVNEVLETYHVSFIKKTKSCNASIIAMQKENERILDEEDNLDRKVKIRRQVWSKVQGAKQFGKNMQKTIPKIMPIPEKPIVSSEFNDSGYEEEEITGHMNKHFAMHDRREECNPLYYRLSFEVYHNTRFKVIADQIAWKMKVFSFVGSFLKMLEWFLTVSATLLAGLGYPQWVPIALAAATSFKEIQAAEMITVRLDRLSTIMTSINRLEASWDGLDIFQQRSVKQTARFIQTIEDLYFSEVAIWDRETDNVENSDELSSSSSTTSNLQDKSQQQQQQGNKLNQVQ